VTARSQRLSAFELQARTILGLPVDTMMVSPGAARAVDPVDEPTAAALNGALSVPESDLRSCGRGFHALATAPEVTAARDRASSVAGRLTAKDARG
jgi:phosphoribosylglycinamide formyltransferase 2